jgi:hypothetical protein
MAVTISGSTPTFSAATGYAGGVVTSGTATATTSGTSVDFTGIPSWVKKITVLFNGVSLNGNSQIQIQIGTSSGVETSGYSSGGWIPSVAATSTTGFVVSAGYIASFTLTGTATIALFSGNQWVQSSVGTNVANGSTSMSGGVKTLSGTLDRIRITSLNGTDSFDAGSVNILYE